MTSFTTDQWVIIGLVFVLGLLVGMWATSGGRRKWKTRYNNEVTERRALETRLKDREAHWTAQEKEWREADARREAALRERPAVAPAATRDPYVEDRAAAPRRDLDRDGVPDDLDRRPLDGDRR